MSVWDSSQKVWRVFVREADKKYVCLKKNKNNVSCSEIDESLLFNEIQWWDENGNNNEREDEDSAHFENKCLSWGLRNMRN